MLIRYPDNPKASLIHSRAEKQPEEPEEEEKNNTAKYVFLLPSSVVLCSLKFVWEKMLMTLAKMSFTKM